MEGVIQRDQMVFQHALVCKCPIAMVLSGGYAAESHQAVAKSIENVLNVFSLISCSSELDQWQQWTKSVLGLLMIHLLARDCYWHLQSCGTSTAFLLSLSYHQLG